MNRKWLCVLDGVDRSRGSRRRHDRKRDQGVRASGVSERPPEVLFQIEMIRNAKGKERQRKIKGGGLDVS